MQDRQTETTNRARPTPAGEEPVLEISNLHVEFDTYKGTVYALDGVDLTVEAGTTAGLVGETGSGKTVTGRSVLGLVHEPGRVTEGSIRFDGRDLLSLPDAELAGIRGNRIAMIFQEPMKSLNPAFTVEQQLTAVVTHHLDVSQSAARERVRTLLADLGLPDPEEVLDAYPHELSGGMAQRVLIALGLSCEPELVIADEPTTALDVTIQAQILELFGRIQEEFGTSILLITHDLGVVDQVCDDVNVMYAGKVVETGPTDEVFDDPLHPYTRGLLHALPERGEGGVFALEGDVPSLRNPPSGCRFVERCPVATETCRSYDPPATAVGDRTVRCLHHEPEMPGSPEEVRDAF